MTPMKIRSNIAATFAGGVSGSRQRDIKVRSMTRVRASFRNASGM